MNPNKKPLIYSLIILLTVTSLIGVFAPATAETWTDITLPYTITESGNYRLSAPWTGTGTALSINASNVVVDGQNNLITLTQDILDYAIAVSPNIQNILIKNIQETNSTNGLFTQSGNLTLQDSTFQNNDQIGFYIQNSTGFTVKNCIFSNSNNGIDATFSMDLTVIDSAFRDCGFGICTTYTGKVDVQNCEFTNNSAAGFYSGYGNFTLADSQFDGNEAGIENLFSDKSVISNVSVTNGGHGIAQLFSNCTIKDSSISNNTVYNLLFQGCNSTVTQSYVADSPIGMLNMKLGTCNFTVEDCHINNNSLYGIAMLNQNNTLINSNYFSNNGFTATSELYIGPYAGALVAQDSNCTVTNNLFRANNNTIQWDATNSQVSTTQTYRNNVLQNNDHTFFFNYLYPNSTRQQLYFYNNLVNDTAYVNPDSFEFGGYVPPSTVLHLNTTFQSGARPYSDGRMIGGNYWAYPNGTGFSQITADTNTDGFSDSSFDFFGNETVYDYLPYSSNYVEKVASLTLAPSAVTITAGSTINFTAIATDQYGNSWNTSATYTVNGIGISGSSITPTLAGTYYIEAAYNQNTAATTLTVVPGALDHFVVEAPASAIAGTPFNIAVVAVDANRNIVTDYPGKVTVTVTGSSGSTQSDAFSSGYWSSDVTIDDVGTFTLSVTDGNGHTGTSRAIIVTSASTPTPTPTPMPTTVHATKDDGTTINLTITGNITSSQITHLTITTNQTSRTTEISFTVTVQNGNSGFTNMTIPKSQAYTSSELIVYIDGQRAQNQGYSEDSQNYYVWFTTNAGTHQVQIRFTDLPRNASYLDPVWYLYALIGIVVAVVAIVVAILAIRRRRK